MGSSDRRKWSGIGLAGVVAAFVGVGSLYALTVPKFLPADETSHVGYALTVSRGDLPGLDSTVPDEVPGMALYFELRREIYTANHPPLYYLPVAVPLRLGVASDHPVLGFELARLLTVALTAVGTVATWWAARALLPDRRDLALLAGALAVLIPAVPRFAGVVYNDGFALAVSAVAMAVSVRLLVDGPTRRLVIGAAAAAAALSLTRAVGIAGAGLVAASAAGSMLLHDPRPVSFRGLRSRWWRAVGCGALVASTACLASGWFWIRNNHRYGDIAGSAYNLERFGYSRRGSTLNSLTDLHWPLTLHRQLWGRIYDNGEFAVGWGALPGLLILGLVAMGVIALVARSARRDERPSVRDVRTWSVTDRGRAAAWLLPMGWASLVYLSTAAYIASGGGVHGRYLFPALPALALLASAALGALPGRRYAVVPVVTVATLVTVGLLWAARFAHTLRPESAWWGEAMTTNAAVHNGVPSGIVWSVVVLAVLGAGAACAAMVVLAAGTDDATRRGAGVSEPQRPDGQDRR